MYILLIKSTFLLQTIFLDNFTYIILLEANIRMLFMQLFSDIKSSIEIDRGVIALAHTDRCLMTAIIQP